MCCVLVLGRSLNRLVSLNTRLMGYSAKSALFVSNEVAQQSLSHSIKLDLEFEKTLLNLDELRCNIYKRKLTTKVEKMVDDYQEYLRLKAELAQLSQKRKLIAHKMAEIKKKNMDNNLKSALVSKGKALKVQHKLVQKEFWEAEEKFILQALKLPNNVQDNVPTENKVIRSYGESVRIIADDGSIKAHSILGKERNMLKFCSGGGYYLYGDLAHLERSLLEYVVNNLEDNGFIPISGPDMFRSLVLEGCDLDFSDRSKIFTLKSDSSLGGASNNDHVFHLCGGSLSSFAAYLTRSLINEQHLPLRLFTQARTYTPVKDADESLLHVLQENTCHVCVACCSSHDSHIEFNSLVENMWNMYLKLGLPIRMVNMSAEQLKLSECLRYELQVWLPSVQLYIPVAYISNYSDFISRRLMLKSSPQSNKNSTSNVHLVHGNFMSATKMIAVVLETYQQTDRTSLPESLKKYTFTSANT